MQMLFTLHHKTSHFHVGEWLTTAVSRGKPSEMNAPVTVTVLHHKIVNQRRRPMTNAHVFGNFMPLRCTSSNCNGKGTVDLGAHMVS